MKARSLLLSLLAGGAVFLAFGGDVVAATCDMDGCSAQIQAAGIVDDGIFRDANKNSGQNLPLYGKVINDWPGCPQSLAFAGAGHSDAPYDCPGEYQMVDVPPTVAQANSFLGTLDRQFWLTGRVADTTVVNGCVADWTILASGTPGNYTPWTGTVFDLGGPANKVALFPENPYDQQPCLSLKFTVFFSDNPLTRDQVLDPATQGIDTMKWNRATLSKIYRSGWIQVRPPDLAGHGTACGDTAEYAVEEDSFVSVYTLPCGVTLRYVSIVAGNDGHDFSACAYDANVGELDAVAGLTESGAGICPDADSDGYVDCQCPGAPSICDCNDADPTIHPGALEACDATADVNCDGKMGTACEGGLTCFQSQCLTPCADPKNFLCPDGSTCTTTSQGALCVPDDCGCAPGQVCINATCVDACENIRCPGTKVCVLGNCVDPCANIQCPDGQVCQGGQCAFSCTCFAGDSGCQDGLSCDSSDACVLPSCKGVACPAGQKCDGASGQCVGFCNPNVVCPKGQKCVDALGCEPICEGVVCSSAQACDVTTGQCMDALCFGVQCPPTQVCSMGSCISAGATGTGGGAAGSGGSGGSDAGVGGNGPASSVAVSSSATVGSSAAVSSSAAVGSGVGGAVGSGTTSSASSGSTGGAGVMPSPGDVPSSDSGDAGGCGCRVAGETRNRSAPPAYALLSFALVAAAMRRARRRG